MLCCRSTSCKGGCSPIFFPLCPCPSSHKDSLLSFSSSFFIHCLPRGSTQLLLQSLLQVWPPSRIFSTSFPLIFSHPSPSAYNTWLCIDCILTIIALWLCQVWVKSVKDKTKSKAKLCLWCLSTNVQKRIHLCHFCGQGYKGAGGRDCIL